MLPSSLRTRNNSLAGKGGKENGKEFARCPYSGMQGESWLFPEGLKPLDCYCVLRVPSDGALLGAGFLCALCCAVGSQQVVCFREAACCVLEPACAACC